VSRPAGWLALTVALVTAGCAPHHGTDAASLNWESAGEAEVPTGVLSPVRVQLHGGAWQRDTGDVREQVELLADHHAADLDGDGSEDAVGLLQVRRFGVRRLPERSTPAAGRAGEPFVRTTTALIAFRNDHGLAVPSRNALPLPPDGQVPDLAAVSGRILVTSWRDGRAVTRTARYHQGKLRWTMTAPGPLFPDTSTSSQSQYAPPS